MSMEDLMKAILGGSGVKSVKSSRQGSQPDPMSELIGAILGGQTSQAQQSQSSGGLGDILGSILGGAQPQQAQQPQAGGDLGDILGSILGGGRLQPQRQQQPSGTIEDFLGSISGQAPMQRNSFLGPIVDKLAKSLGIPPVVAQMIVSFAISKLMPSAASGSGSGAIVPQPRPQQQPSYVPAPSQTPAQSQDGWNLDSLLDTFGAGSATTGNYIQQSGMSRELANQMGMDESMANDSLQQVFQMLQGALAKTQTQQARPKAPASSSAKRTGKRTNRGQY